MEKAVTVIMPEYTFKGISIKEQESDGSCNGCLFKEKYTDYGYQCWPPRAEFKVQHCSKGKNGRLFNVIFVKK